MPGLELLCGHLPTLLARNNSFHLKFSFKSIAIEEVVYSADILYVCFHPSDEYLSAKLDVIVKKVGFCILF